MNENDIAWLAGFFEADGHIGITKMRTGFALRASVAGKDESLVNQFGMLGGRLCVERRQKQRLSGKKSSDILRWQLHGKEALIALEKMEPYFRSPRQEKRIEIARGFIEVQSKKKRYQSDYQKNEMKRYYEMMKEINSGIQSRVIFGSKMP